MKYGNVFRWVAAFVGCSVLLATSLPHASAQSNGEFSLQVTPSPLVATVKPGTTTVLDLKIRNAGTGTEELKIEPRAFTFEDTTGQVSLKDTTPPDIAQWISFSAPTFTVKPGEWFTQKVKISLPKDTGFSYSFALVISRKNNPTPTGAGRLLRGSLAVFTLVNVDRPGATRKLEVAEFTSTNGVYEYLPATFSIKFKNTGNTIVQPYGNVFIQRGANAKTPIATLPVNETHSYLLPSTARTLHVSWKDGFPVYEAAPTAENPKNQKLVWNWDEAKVSNFRIGRYTAKLVAVYNDGTRDVPIEQDVSFWVVPWKGILLFIAVATGLFFLGRWRNKRRTDKAVKRALAAAAAKKKEEAKEEKHEA